MLHMNLINPKKVLVFTSCSHAGKFFFCSLLDGHPNVLGVNPTKLTGSIMHIVKEAQKSGSAGMIDYIYREVKTCFTNDNWKKYSAENTDKSFIDWVDDFGINLREQLSDKDIFSDKGIFLAIYWALYVTFYGKYKYDLEPIIFMDVHDDQNKTDEYIKWLDEMGFEVVLLKAIRSPYIKLGSYIKITKDQGLKPENVLRHMHYLSREVYSTVEKDYPVIRYRFEDLKLEPRVVLQRICDSMGIPWDDRLLEASLLGKPTTFVSHGEKVKGFALKQVYYTYEEYFDSLDRMKLDILFSRVNEAYDYPYMKRERLPLDDEEIVKLFLVPFKFEKYIYFADDESRDEFRSKLIERARAALSGYSGEEGFDFGKYIGTK